MSGFRVGVITCLSIILCVVAVAEEYDATSPTDLIVSGGASVRWVATGDDGNIGTAYTYDLRYSITPITSTSWAVALPAMSEPAPARAGTTQSCYISRLIPGRTYYFAIRACDDAGNWSGMSKVLAKSPQAYFVGDTNGDFKVDVGDPIYLLNYVFEHASEPKPWGSGDANCDGLVSVADIVHLVKYVFQSGPLPGTGCPQ